MKKFSKTKRIVIAAVAAFLVASGIILTALFTTIYTYVPHYYSSDFSFDVSTVPSESEQVKLMTFNVRQYNLDDTGKKSVYWRCELIARLISEQQPDVIAFQELQSIHWDFLEKHLKGYTYYVVYRQKRVLAEAEAIAVRTDRFEIRSKNTFWLSDTPEKISKYKESSHYRSASTVSLYDKVTGKIFDVYSTHLENDGRFPYERQDKLRTKQAGVLFDFVEKSENAAFVMGDFNSRYGDKSIDFLKSKAKDAYDFYDTEYKNNPEKPNRRAIDFCFFIDSENNETIKNSVKIHSVEIIKTLYDGVRPSDHYPVLYTVSID